MPLSSTFPATFLSHRVAVSDLDGKILKYYDKANTMWITRVDIDGRYAVTEFDGTERHSTVFINGSLNIQSYNDIALNISNDIHK